jgi:large subunit ribosomal protein L25
MDTLTVRLSPRAVVGRKVKQLRRGGVIPVHLYGEGTESLNLQVDSTVLRRLVPQAGRNIPVSVDVEGRDGDNICFIREVQRHPVTEDLLHIDFLRVDVSQTITTGVPIELKGEAPGVVNLGGTLLQTLQALEVEALPLNIPTVLTIDVSGLDDFEKSVRVSDLEVPGDVTVLSDAAEMVARVMAPRLEEEPEVEEEEIEGVEGEEGEEEGEAAEPEESQEAPRGKRPR